ncbi:methylenetetrahydrofolate reductase [NAD(P)H] [Hyphomicrobium sp. ghe19]|uniref:methylenetetrahydrofolate reductase [NAD(P)H] n=1 Tax=Hyphomicrobium sp. ghe19 TaxID=2682968 RepID=UPI0030CB8475
MIRKSDLPPEVPRIVPPTRRASRFLGQGDIDVSFEFFPPRTAAMEKSLWRSIDRLGPLRPTSLAVTSGTGGTTRERTRLTVERILRETTLAPAVHLTRVGNTREEIAATAAAYWSLGVRQLVALQGDSPAGEPYEPGPNDYEYTCDMVADLKGIANFEIAVAGYPEKHPASATVAADIAALKNKVDAGADRIITQFFFDNKLFFRFEEQARTHGVAAPIIPGILPIHNFKQVAAVAARCGVSIPSWLARRFEGLENDPETHRLAAAAFAAEQVLGLVDRGVTEFHFFTLNRADLVYGICHMLGLRAAEEA